MEDLKTSLLHFSFVIIYIIHTMLVSLKNHLDYVKDNIFECFLKSIIDFYYLKKKTIMMKRLRLQENIIKDI